MSAPFERRIWMREHVDPLTALIKLLRSLALADHLGDISEDIVQAWRDVGLGEIPEAEGDEPMLDDDGEPEVDGDGEPRTYACGDILIDKITEQHGVLGLFREREFDVRLTWTTDDGDDRDFEDCVKADTPMDAARVAYLMACDEYSVESLGYAEAAVGDERFELQPVACVRVVRPGSEPQSEAE